MKLSGLMLEDTQATGLACALLIVTTMQL